MGSTGLSLVLVGCSGGDDGRASASASEASASEVSVTATTTMPTTGGVSESLGTTADAGSISESATEATTVPTGHGYERLERLERADRPIDRAVSAREVPRSAEPGGRGRADLRRLRGARGRQRGAHLHLAADAGVRCPPGGRHLARLFARREESGQGPPSEFMQHGARVRERRL